MPRAGETEKELDPLLFIVLEFEPFQGFFYVVSSKEKSGEYCHSYL